MHKLPPAGGGPLRERLVDDEIDTYDTAPFAGELAAAPSNHEIGTSLLFENDHIRVFEARLEPGERGPFHIHDKPYFWTVVDAGLGLQRFPDGTYSVQDYAVGETKYLVHSQEEP